MKTKEPKTKFKAILSKMIKIEKEKLNSNGIRIICEFDKEAISNDTKKGDLFKEIRENIKENEGVWALLGNAPSEENKEIEYICLQVASSSSIKTEIIADIRCMLPFDKEADEKNWSSYFYKDVFKITYGLDSKCQKYNHMYKNFDRFCIIQIDPEEYLKNENTNGFGIMNYAEVKYALENKPLYWHPNRFKKENQILKHLSKEGSVTDG